MSTIASAARPVCFPGHQRNIFEIVTDNQNSQVSHVVACVQFATLENATFAIVTLLLSGMDVVGRWRCPTTQSLFSRSAIPCRNRIAMKYSFFNALLSSTHFYFS
jgi:hypothetical protein